LQRIVEARVLPSGCRQRLPRLCVEPSGSKCARFADRPHSHMKRQFAKAPSGVPRGAQRHKKKMKTYTVSYITHAQAQRDSKKAAGSENIGVQTYRGTRPAAGCAPASGDQHRAESTRSGRSDGADATIPAIGPHFRHGGCADRMGETCRFTLAPPDAPCDRSQPNRQHLASSPCYTNPVLLSAMKHHSSAS
jgi:hypothetical protein